MALSTENAESIARCLEMLRAEYNSKATKSADARWQLSGEGKMGLESSILKKAEDEYVTVRGRMMFPGVEPEQVIRLVQDCPNRTAWDDMLQQGLFARHVGEAKTAMLPESTVDIIRLIYKGIPPVTSRDLCLLRAWGKDEDGACWLVAESCEDDSVPPDSECVRAELRECGYMCVPVSGGCEVTYIAQTKFNGWIPVFMQNIMVKQQPQTLLKMYEVITAKLQGA